MSHIPVLLKEVVEYLSPRPGEIFIDCTCGNAGHALAIAKAIGPTGKIFCLDLDEGALKRAQNLVRSENPQFLERIIFINENFANLERVVEAQKIGRVDGILADLGMSSDQLEDSVELSSTNGQAKLGGRGFSFLKNEPLDMRFSTKQDLTASQIVNLWLAPELERIFKEYGEERFAKKIAFKIVQAKKLRPIQTTGQLLEIISRAIPERFKRGRAHFATKVFQSLRIAVNKELENLEKFLPQALRVLNPGGRMAIISFHSLEDRAVKIFFREQAAKDRLKILTKRPVIATRDEVFINPRSRSAKLRAAIKI